ARGAEGPALPLPGQHEGDRRRGEGAGEGATQMQDQSLSTPLEHARAARPSASAGRASFPLHAPAGGLSCRGMLDSRGPGGAMRLRWQGAISSANDRCPMRTVTLLLAGWLLLAGQAAPEDPEPLPHALVHA